MVLTFFSAGLYLRPWKERFNPETEDLTIAPVWILLFSLPGEYWDPDTLRDIGNDLSEFIKVSEQKKDQRYTSFARICVYLDLSKELPEAINLSWEDEEWLQPIDYVQIPFRCRQCHEYGHLGQNCPHLEVKTAPTDPSQEKPRTTQDGFTQVKNRRRNKASGHSKAKRDASVQESRSRNAFETLEGLEEEGSPKGEECDAQPTKAPKPLEGVESQQMEIVEEADDEEMELGELDLDAIEA